LKLIATVLGLELDLPKSGEFGAALGAARLGILASTGQSSEGVITAPEFGGSVAPQAEVSDAYESAYQSFRNAFANIKSAQ
jgi:xylulokinase